MEDWRKENREKGRKTGGEGAWGGQKQGWEGWQREGDSAGVVENLAARASRSSHLLAQYTCLCPS